MLAQPPQMLPAAAKEAHKAAVFATNPIFIMSPISGSNYLTAAGLCLFRSRRGNEPPETL
jgi:hypothetical protein